MASKIFQLFPILCVGGNNVSLMASSFFICFNEVVARKKQGIFSLLQCSKWLWNVKKEMLKYALWPTYQPYIFQRQNSGQFFPVYYLPNFEDRNKKMQQVLSWEMKILLKNMQVHFEKDGHIEADVSNGFLNLAKVKVAKWAYKAQYRFIHLFVICYLCAYVPWDIHPQYDKNLSGAKVKREKIHYNFI